MSTLFAVADWVAALNPFALTALVCLLGLAMTALVLIAWSLLLAARSGAGEPHPEELAEPCESSTCAWCHPGEARGICPAHAEQMKQEARR